MGDDSDLQEEYNAYVKKFKDWETQELNKLKNQYSVNDEDIKSGLKPGDALNDYNRLLEVKKSKYQKLDLEYDRAKKERYKKTLDKKIEQETKDITISVPDLKDNTKDLKYDTKGKVKGKMTDQDPAELIYREKMRDNLDRLIKLQEEQTKKLEDQHKDIRKACTDIDCLKDDMKKVQSGHQAIHQAIDTKLESKLSGLENFNAKLDTNFNTKLTGLDGKLDSKLAKLEKNSDQQCEDGKCLRGIGEGVTKIEQQTKHFSCPECHETNMPYGSSFCPDCAAPVFGWKNNPDWKPKTPITKR